MTPRNALHLLRLFAILFALSGAAGAAEVVLDLSGKSVGFGSKILVNSGAQRLPASRVYEYKLEGTVKGTGALADLVPSGTTFQQLADLAGGNVVIPLDGTAENPTGKLPFGVLDQSFSGPIDIPNIPLPVNASFKLRGSVQANGSVQYELSIGALPLGISPGTLLLEPGTKLTVRSLFEALAGQYHGLIHSDTVGREGHARATLTLGGLVTATVRIGAKTFNLKSSLQADRSTPEITLGTSGLKIKFTSEAANPGQLKMVVSGAAGTMGEGIAKRSRLLDGPPLTRMGAYTVVLRPPALQAGDNAATKPAGMGYFTAKITVNGVVNITGKLCDGKALTVASAVVGDDDEIPFFMPLLAGQGVVTGTLTLLPEGENDDLDGELRWVKPGLATEKVLKQALDLTLTAQGSRYYKPAAAQRVLRLTRGVVTLSAGNLAAPIEAPVLLDQLNRLLPQNASGVKTTINLTSGVFTGTFKPPTSRTAVTFQGVLLQKQNAGGGYFIGLPALGDAAQTGEVVLEPQPL